MDSGHATVLHLVAEEGCVRCARLLMPYGVDVDAKTKEGDTALIRAAKRGRSV